MIKTIRNRFTCRQQPQQAIHDDRLQSMPMDEDLVPRKFTPHSPIPVPEWFYFSPGDEIAYKSAIISDDESVCPSMIPPRPSEQSCSYSNVSKHNQRQEKSTREKIGLFIPAGMKPGQRVKVRYSNGTKLRTIIPPRSKWMAKNCNGTLRSFFLVPVDPCATNVSETQTSSIAFGEGENMFPAKSVKKVRFSTQSCTVCQCTPSMSRYDPMCPFHGTDTMRRC
mmetsp:Transcript_15582/g.33752  ORF Transcript_15582/g.33752 Transcript_15582/m.33752 type:complete len:223 (-) Transcript_15582:91-759(-)